MITISSTKTIQLPCVCPCYVCNYGSTNLNGVANLEKTSVCFAFHLYWLYCNCHCHSSAGVLLTFFAALLGHLLTLRNYDEWVWATHTRLWGGESQWNTTSIHRYSHSMCVCACRRTTTKHTEENESRLLLFGMSLLNNHFLGIEQQQQRRNKKDSRKRGPSMAIDSHSNFWGILGMYSEKSYPYTDTYIELLYGHTRWRNPKFRIED